MIFCINRNKIKVDPKEVQRNVDLEYLLSEECIKYFNKVDEAYANGFIPLSFAVSVRSITDNRVIETESEGNKIYYTNLANLNEHMTSVHKGHDLVMYLTSIGMLYNIDFALEVDEIMLKHSQFQAIGLFNSDVIYPIIYSHILMSDEGMNLLEPYLKSDRKIVKIRDMQKKGNIPALIDTLIIV